jgi:hypothetical protein
MSNLWIECYCFAWFTQWRWEWWKYLHLKSVNISKSKEGYGAISLLYDHELNHVFWELKDKYSKWTCQQIASNFLSMYPIFDLNLLQV